MQGILETVGSFLNNLGPLIVLPIVITLLGIILGQKLLEALRSGVMTAVAFVGIFLTVGLLGEQLSTLGTAFAESTRVSCFSSITTISPERLSVVNPSITRLTGNRPSLHEKTSTAVSITTDISTFLK